MFVPRTNNLTGVAPATLQQWLADAQQALHDLSTGAKGESFSYTQGDGSKSVTYTRADHRRAPSPHSRAAVCPRHAAPCAIRPVF